MKYVRRAGLVLFLGLTLGVFLSPAISLGLPPNRRQLFDEFGQYLPTALLVVTASIVVLVTLRGLRGATSNPRGRFRLLSLSLGGALALSNALRYLFGLSVSGAMFDFVQVLWYASPMALLAAAVWPTKQPDQRGGMPTQAVLLAFPLVFTFAALSRVDLSTYLGAPLPTPAGWILSYTPTLVVVAVALIGWLALDRQEGVQPSLAAEGLIVGFAFVAGMGIASNGTLAFILSATVTWGSGYQLFVSPQPLPSLSLVLAAISAALTAFALATLRLREKGREALAPVMALAAVMSGIFPSANSVLGSFAALTLLWLYSGSLRPVLFPTPPASYVRVAASLEGSPSEIVRPLEAQEGTTAA